MHLKTSNSDFFNNWENDGPKHEANPWVLGCTSKWEKLVPNYGWVLKKFFSPISSQNAIKSIWSLSKRHFIFVNSYYISDDITKVGALGKYLKFLSRLLEIPMLYTWLKQNSRAGWKNCLHSLFLVEVQVRLLENWEGVCPPGPP